MDQVKLSLMMDFYMMAIGKMMHLMVKGYYIIKMVFKSMMEIFQMLFMMGLVNK